MKLVQKHKPLSEQTLKALLVDHSHARCNMCHCQVKHGGLIGWSERLYDIAKPSYPNVTRQECDGFVYDLFIRGPLRGRAMEEHALVGLEKAVPSLQFVEADETTDVKYAVDIVCMNGPDIKAGVQVKPLSFLKQAHAVQWNHDKNKLWGYPVYYLYYDNTGQFTKNSWTGTIDALRK
jgi:hypothetical protein